MQSNLICRKLDGVYASNNAAAPDTYTYDPLQAKPPSDDFVISRNSLGEIVSTYGSSNFDLRPYTTDEREAKSQIQITKNIPEEYQTEARWLWFLNYAHGVGKSGNSLNPKVLYRRFHSAIKPLCEFSKKKEASAIEVLESERLLAELLYLKQASNTFCINIYAMLRMFNLLGGDICNFNVAYTDNLQSFLFKRCNWFESQQLQHPVIPPELYQALNSQAWEVISEFESNSKGLVELLRFLIDEPDTESGSDTWYQRNKVLFDFMLANNLTEIASKYRWDLKRREIVHYFSCLQQVCKVLIHFYSGMRDNEVMGLKYHCLSLDNNNNRRRARLLGNTTKYIGNKLDVMWVTSNEIERVILVLQKIAKPISRGLNVSLEKECSKGEVPCPLFLSTNYIIRPSYRKRRPYGAVQEWRIFGITNNPLFDSSLFTITNKHLDFLEKIEPERDWRNKEGSFAEGQLWNFTTHQFRRSLAVFAAQSGLVSIGSLQTQLKHLLREVTFYYGNGAENADGLFDSSGKDHMASIYTQNKPLADFTAYIIDILFNTEKLVGINGRRLERTAKANTPEKQLLVLNDRKVTMSKFEKGLMAYKETPLGGCETLTPCDKKLTRSLVACIDCEQADIVPSKLNRTIDRLTLYVEQLPKSSVEYRSEAADLAKLVVFRNREVG